MGATGPLVRRNLLHIKRQPETLTDVTIQPVMFVLLFAYVFGGSIQLPGVTYQQWLLPGIMAQTMAFSSFVVAIGLNNDLSKGVIDRLRSLPIPRSSVLLARSMSSMLHSSIGVVVMSLTGLVVGWRINTGILQALAGLLLLLLFGFAMICIGIFVGCSLSSVEAVNGVMFSTMFPVTFLANTFAPTQGMPPFIRVLAEWNPISALVQSLRQMWGNNGDLPTPGAWPLQHAVPVSIGWSLLIAADRCDICTAGIASIRESHPRLTGAVAANGRCALRVHESAMVPGGGGTPVHAPSPTL